MSYNSALQIGGMCWRTNKGSYREMANFDSIYGHCSTLILKSTMETLVAELYTCYGAT